MSCLIIRDDDISFWTKLEEIKLIYEPLFLKGIKVSFSVIPFSVKMFNIGEFSTFYQELDEKPLGENKELVSYLKDRIKEGLIEIMLHGYNHLYAFKCGEDIKLATKENLKKCKQVNKKVIFIGEYNFQDYYTLYKKTKLGKEYLEDLFEVKIKNFVPPSNQINRAGIKAVINNNLNISGIVGKVYNREITFRGILTYLDRFFFFLRNKDIIYPKIANYGKHKELVGYALTPSTNWEKYYKQLEYCLKHQYPFQIATHHWELNKYPHLRELFYEIISLALENGVKTKLLKEVL